MLQYRCSQSLRASVSYFPLQSAEYLVSHRLGDHHASTVPYSSNYLHYRSLDTAGRVETSSHDSESPRETTAQLALTLAVGESPALAQRYAPLETASVAQHVP